MRVLKFSYYIIIISMNGLSIFDINIILYYIDINNINYEIQYIEYIYKN